MLKIPKGSLIMPKMTKWPLECEQEEKNYLNDENWLWKVCFNLNCDVSKSHYTYSRIHLEITVYKFTDNGLRIYGKFRNVHWCKQLLTYTLFEGNILQKQTPIPNCCGEHLQWSHSWITWNNVRFRLDLKHNYRVALYSI